ncbi:hypothetical protein TI05_18530, partial [Achromatium sp. WMS3]
MTALTNLLDSLRQAAPTERDKGTRFEELTLFYLRNEPSYRELYAQVWSYGDWAAEQGLDQRDVGIDLVAQTAATGEFHAIQCKFYAADYKLQKSDIDSFFTASGQKPFVQRIIVSTTQHWSEHAEKALLNQQTPVLKLELFDLEKSQIDWSSYQLAQAQQVPILKPQKVLREHQQSAVKKVVNGFKTVDRGKLIMACGTGKTFTSLKIAEQVAGSGKLV